MNRKGQAAGAERFIGIVMSLIFGGLILLFFPAITSISFYVLNMTQVSNDNYNIIGALIPVFWMGIAIVIPMYSIFVGGGGEA